MKNNNRFFTRLLLAFGVLFNLGALAQHDDVHYCHTNEKMDALKAANPAIALDMEQSQHDLETWTANYIANEYDPNARTAIYTIPVVFHVLHTNGEENISDAQIHNAVQLMNDNFNKLNPSWSTVNPAFLGIVADCQIQFVLARKKNNGTCTNGITRTYTESTHEDIDDNQVVAVQDAQGNWPGNKYLNIFVVNDAGGAAGYTTYPANWSATSMQNGIKILHNYVGNIGTSSPTTSTSLSHEVGHWLNLKHCWGDSNNPTLPTNCSDDDDVTDTPNTIGWNTCNVNGGTCGSAVDNVENYMEYSYCSKMFTNGQKARMHAALESNTGDRNNLWTPTNLAATGVSLPEVLCQVEFAGNRTEICAGESITFVDLSYNAVTGTNWTFTGGTPASSSSANPTVTYDTPGIYSVSLQATDGSTMLTDTKTNYIIVHANQGDPLPYSEGFETLSLFPDNDRFTLTDDDGDEAWEITTAASSGGSKSVWLNNFSASQSGTKDAFMSGTIDLSGVDPAADVIFDFKYAYRKRTASDDEWLRFYVSKDCGETWVLRKNLHGNSLSTSFTGSSYTPADAAAWYDVSINNITSDYYVSNLRFKFEFENDGGNNIYIDDINLYAETIASVGETATSAFSIYPNPVTDVMQINLVVHTAADYTVTVVNVLGETVAMVYNGELMTGSNQLGFSAATLPQGIYFVRIEGNSESTVHKFVKN